MTEAEAQSAPRRWTMLPAGALVELPVDAIRIGRRHRRDLGDVDRLAASIAAVGLLHPLVVRPDGHLIAGERRLAAVRLLGRATVPAHVVDLAELVRGEQAENTQRKDFTPSEAVAIGAAIEELEREQAARRVGGRPRKDGEETSGKLPEVSEEQGRATARTAQAVGLSRHSYERAREVVEAAETEPERYRPLAEEMDRTGRVNGVYKKLVTARAAERIAAEPPPLPDGPFRVIVADPPWSYASRPDDPSHQAANPYPSMPVGAIAALPVGERAHADAVLWLWTTNAHMREAFTVLDAWGFAHKTILTWVKDRMGTGDWLRGQSEHCLLAARGRPTLRLTDQTTVLRAPARDHSRKPEEFYGLVEALCPGSKLELFARQRREGWAAHGSDATD